jgi:hypothetical protein
VTFSFGLQWRHIERIRLVGSLLWSELRVTYLFGVFDFIVVDESEASRFICLRLKKSIWSTDEHCLSQVLALPSCQLWVEFVLSCHIWRNSLSNHVQLCACSDRKPRERCSGAGLNVVRRICRFALAVALDVYVCKLDFWSWLEGDNEWKRELLIFWWENQGICLLFSISGCGAWTWFWSGIGACRRWSRHDTVWWTLGPKSTVFTFSYYSEGFHTNLSRLTFLSLLILLLLLLPEFAADSAGSKTKNMTWFSTVLVTIQHTNGPTNARTYALVQIQTLCTMACLFNLFPVHGCECFADATHTHANAF